MSRTKSKQALRLMVVVLFTLLAGGCPEAQDMIEKAIQTPKVEIKDLFFSGLSEQNIDLDLLLEVDNPTPLALNFNGLEYELALAGRPLAAGSSSSATELKASDKSQVSVPLSLAYNEIKTVYDQAQGQDEIPYQLSGKALLKMGGAEIPVPFKTSGMLPVIRPPRILSVGLKVDNLSLSGADLILSIKIDNPNSFPLSIQGMDYALQLEGKDFSSGQVGLQAVPKKSSGSIEAPLHLDFISMGSWAYSLLTKGKAVYALHYQAVYTINNHPVKHREEKQGTLNIGR